MLPFETIFIYGIVDIEDASWNGHSPFNLVLECQDIKTTLSHSLQGKHHLMKVFSVTKINKFIKKPQLKPLQFIEEVLVGVHYN